MSISLSTTRIGVRMVVASFSWSSCHLPSSSCMCAARLTEPRLQTAISVSLVLSVISVQRLELWTVTTCDCGERTLHASMNGIQGCPYQKLTDSILRQRHH